MMNKHNIEKYEKARHLWMSCSSLDMGKVFALLLSNGYVPEMHTVERMCVLGLVSKDVVFVQIHTPEYLGELVVDALDHLHGPVVSIAIQESSTRNKFIFTKKPKAQARSTFHLT